MNEEETAVGGEIHDLVEKGRQKIADSQRGAADGLQAVTEYVRANPWAAVGIAAAVGGLIAVVTKGSRPKRKNLDAVRDWLEEAYSKVPNEKQLRAAVDSTGAPSFLKDLGKKLRLNCKGF